MNVSVAGMLKRTSYGKIYRPDVRFIQTSARVRIYLADVQLPVHGFLCIRAGKNLSAPTRDCVRADAMDLPALPPSRPPRSLASLPRGRELCPHGHERASARTHDCVRADA
jgi:hypothetical protein